ncbi:MAG: NAD(P)H-dependent oxidoreductase [Clostridia bacterium]|nr:NAD(P)H-dependent oxidoreductase [Clostridia bacterium]
MKRIMILLLAAVMLLSLAACGSSKNEPVTSNVPQDTAKNNENTEAESNGSSSAGSVSGAEESKESGKTLVVYFSWSGNLDKMAHWVADETGGDLVRVTAKEAYPENYNDTANRAKKEQDDGVRPAINVDLTAEQFAKYDTVFFGFPVWWYDLPMTMWTFLESYDFSGKTVIPFFSHEGSSNGASALPRIEELAKGATVRTSDALSIRGGNVASSEENVREWVKGLD